MKNKLNTKIKQFQDFVDNVGDELSELKDIEKSFVRNEDDVHNLPNLQKTKFNKVTRKLDTLSKNEINDRINALSDDVEEPNHTFKIKENSNSILSFSMYSESDYTNLEYIKNQLLLLLNFNHNELKNITKNQYWIKSNIKNIKDIIYQIYNFLIKDDINHDTILNTFIEDDKDIMKLIDFIIKMINGILEIDNLNIEYHGWINDKLIEIRNGIIEINDFLNNTPELYNINENIIDYDSDNIKDFYNTLNSTNQDIILLDSIKEVGKEYDIEIVDYNQFYAELPDEYKDGAPPRSVDLFALVNPVTHKIRVIINSSITKEDLKYIYRMMKHENIHVLQRKKSNNKSIEGMDLKDKKKYFSNKSEIMAFSQSIVDMIMEYKPKTKKEALLHLKNINLWKSITNKVDIDVLNRYKKYIYLYLDYEFNKL